MKHFRYLFMAPALVSCSAGAQKFVAANLVRVSCSSNDDGKTCFGYGETYSDGTSDACGRVPGGPEFALKMTYEVSGNTLCETVTKTSDPRTMPVGQRFCSIYLERRPQELIYRFSDDPPNKIRHSYNATRSDKWCQHLVDALL